MLIRSVTITNFRSFATAQLNDVGQVNVFVGRNNSGKSAVLRALYAFQEGSGVTGPDVRRGQPEAKVTLRLDAVDPAYFGTSWTHPPPETLQLLLRVDSTLQSEVGEPGVGGVQGGVGQIPAREPENWIYPFLSRRKTAGYDESVNLNATNAVTPDLRYLAAKVARLNNPTHARHGQYVEACEEIIGFVPSAVASLNGQKPGILVGRFDSIYIEAMGEGVANLLGLITDLCIAEDRLFLIEEPENDVHPQALKRVLALMVKGAATNQFFVTTHSHIVAKYLGAADRSRVFFVEGTSVDGLPTSTARSLESTQERLLALSDLGYDLYDFDIWEGWLFLEESSAERIIRDVLVPLFAPRLERIRTIGLKGRRQVEPAFADFHRLFLFSHLENRYLNRAWVIVDGDPEGTKTVDELKSTYQTWDPSRFSTWTKPQFELFYPQRFRAEVDSALALNHREKRAAKKRLLEDVLAWVASSSEDAVRNAFLESAAEVVDRLRQIESSLFGDDG